jgi:hypothetical protein
LFQVKIFNSTIPDDVSCGSDLFRLRNEDEKNKEEGDYGEKAMLRQF